MRFTQLFGRTLREAPADAESESHRLLLRAALVQQQAAGIYSYLPLGWRVLRKVEQIVREEMDHAGGQELLMPHLSPAELWEESGRKADYGPTLMTLSDRRERELVLGPTHEEVIVDLFRRNVQSYKELPQLLYQIQTKFRDEPRPRMGLIRGREFGMMDLYSFHADQEDLDRAYDAMYAAYERVYQRCGVPAIAVHADSGTIGGRESQEFMLFSEIGEDEILVCSSCGYAANAEKAELRKPNVATEDALPMEEVSTPGKKTIEDLMRFLDIPATKTVKAVFYVADGGPVFVAIRGDLAVNEVKLRNALKSLDVRLMTDEEVTKAGLVAGSASPVGLKNIQVVADDSVLSSPNLVGGANKADAHLRNVNYGRDWLAEIVADIALAHAGDLCARCGSQFESKRGIEMGHIFKLGTRYTEKMHATFLDASGHDQYAIMGCYGIGTSRLVHCIIEANRDERGIIWPASVAPFDVHLVGLGLDRPEVATKAESLYEDLQQDGLDVLYDDRSDTTAGVKFNDADLVGLPLRVTVSPRSLEKDAIETKRRDTADVELAPYAEAVETVRRLLTS
ncbi:MAG: proline--tRNA ligase [Dehalococcoidia bacterium]|nr:proline--tRNA ligase [Dehalococcoidia bacterium]